ncbi:MAG: D-alanine--D-alanine ligase A [Planctomycetota bacterium]|nr:MAG: D-alanine--D-alanine ligase A [Planctomycetota bacterium]
MVLTLLFGGISAEHEISLRSARAVREQLDSKKYDVRLLGISKEGGWLGAQDSARLLAGKEVAPCSHGPYLPEGTEVVFPVLHGPMGEDGTIQGWLELMNMPFVGSGCLGSALAMDKSVAKHVLRSANIPVLSWSDVSRSCWQKNRGEVLDEVERERTYPCFVKPTCLGSSVGISRVEDRAQLHDALELAFQFGTDALVEPAVAKMREFEIAILDGEHPFVSLPGEIVMDGWYDYDSKYQTNEAKLVIDDDLLPPRLADGLRDLALQAFRVLRLSGLARVDFLMDKSTGRYVLNEVNTMPGFTSISMYPKLMEKTGVGFTELCDRLIDLAFVGRPDGESDSAKPKVKESEMSAG